MTRIRLAAMTIVTAAVLALAAPVLALGSPACVLDAPDAIDPLGETLSLRANCNWVINGTWADGNGTTLSPPATGMAFYIGVPISRNDGALRTFSYRFSACNEDNASDCKSWSISVSQDFVHPPTCSIVATSLAGSPIPGHGGAVSVTETCNPYPVTYQTYMDGVSIGSGYGVGGGSTVDVEQNPTNAPRRITFTVHGCANDVCTTVDTTILQSAFTSSTPPPVVPITPQLGMWWNPSESGTGYMFDQSGSTLIITTYSYTPAGAPQWYLVVGQVSNNTFFGTLDKYINGQCISCAYRNPSAEGNDGQMSITFTSPTTADMTLPGGRSFPIVKYQF